MPVIRSTLPLVLAVLVTACGPFRSSIATGPDGLRTFTPQTEINGQRILCTTGGSIDPVIGTLRGRVGAQEPVWILTADNRSLSIVWPAGFLAKFDPVAALYNDRAERVAVEGDEVVLGQVSRASHAGSYGDPYIASGIVFNGCYQFAP